MSEFHNFNIVLWGESATSSKNHCKSDIHVGNIASHTQIIPHIHAFNTNKPDIYFK